MADSKKTEKPEVQAQHAYDALLEKSDFYPKIIVRKPYKGDTHPCSRAMLQHFLSVIPKKYVYGLRKIELRARNHQEGAPFGFYTRRDKSIVLFSLPPVLEFPLGEDAINKRHINRAYLPHKATIEYGKSATRIYWKNERSRAVWFLVYVVFHELGHHYNEQYKLKNKRPVRLYYNELTADLRAFKIIRQEHKRRAELKRQENHS